MKRYICNSCDKSFCCYPFLSDPNDDPDEIITCDDCGAPICEDCIMDRHPLLDDWCVKCVPFDPTKNLK